MNAAGRVALASASVQRLRVFPLVPNGEHPAVDDWRGAATTDADQIKAWWSNGDANLGVATGGNLLVLAARDRKDISFLDDVYELPFSFRVETPSGGIDVYLNVPEDGDVPVTGSLPGFPGVHVRYDGDFVLGPGSKVDGRACRPLPAPPSERGVIAAVPEAIVAATRRRGADEAIRMLQHLDPDGWHNLVAIVPDGPITGRTFPPGSWDKIRAWIEKWNGRANLYFSVNEPRADAPHKKLKKENIAFVRAIHVDADPKDEMGFEAERNRIHEAVTALHLPPSVLVDSGGGYQPFWKLVEKLDASEQFEWAENQARGISKTALGGDATQNIDRVMRLPGTVNIPDARKRGKGRRRAVARLLDLNEAIYAPEQLRTLAAPIANEQGAKDKDANISALIQVLQPRIDDFRAAITLDDLPADLRTRFEAELAANEQVATLWRGEKNSKKDTTGSGVLASLAAQLHKTDRYSPEEFGRLAFVCDHVTREKLDARQLARAWVNCGIPSAREEFGGGADAMQTRADGAVAEPAAAEWPEPADLWADESEPPDLAPRLVPELIERYARDRGWRLGVEPGAVATVTLAAFAAIQSENEGGLLLVKDELAGFFGGMDAYRSKGEKDRTYWIEAKDGKPFTVDRKNSDPIVVPRNAVAIVGCVQPDRLRTLNREKRLTDDGFLQRFWPVLLKRTGPGEDAPADEALDRSISSLAQDIVDAPGGRRYKFEPEADAEREAIEALKERYLSRADHTGAFAQFIDKLPDSFAQLALVFHFIEWYSDSLSTMIADAPPELISQVTARRARLFLSEFVLGQARAVYRNFVQQGDAELHAQWIAGYILSRSHEVISDREIDRACPALRRLEKRPQRLAAMHELEAEGWAKAARLGREKSTPQCMTAAFKRSPFAKLRVGQACERRSPKTERVDAPRNKNRSWRNDDRR